MACTVGTWGLVEELFSEEVADQMKLNFAFGANNECSWCWSCGQCRRRQGEWESELKLGMVGARLNSRSNVGRRDPGASTLLNLQLQRLWTAAGKSFCGEGKGFLNVGCTTQSTTFWLWRDESGRFNFTSPAWKGCMLLVGKPIGLQRSGLRVGMRSSCGTAVCRADDRFGMQTAVKGSVEGCITSTWLLVTGDHGGWFGWRPEFKLGLEHNYLG